MFFHYFCIALFVLWPRVELVFVYVNLPPLGLIIGLTGNPIKQLNTDPILAHSGFGDVQTQAWKTIRLTKILSCLKTNTAY